MPSNPLQTMHEQAEATFLPYGTHVQIVETYGEVEAEYAAIRKGAALLDAPHRGVVVLTGKDRLSFLNSLLTNETKKLAAGQGVYAFLLNIKGRITMDVNVLHGEDATLLEMDGRMTGALCKLLEKHLFSEDVKFWDASEQLGRLTLIGPRAGALLNRVMEGGVESLSENLRHVKRTVAHATVTLFRNDLCEEPQYDLIVPRDHLVQLWQVLHEAGNSHGEADGGLRAIGWAAFNTARIEAGTPLFGIDLTDNYLPMETGHWYLRGVHIAKGCYLGQEVVARMHAHHTVARLFVGLRIEGGALPIAGTDMLEGTSQIGMITSSCMSPMLGGVPVAMGYVKKAFAEPGKTLEVFAEAARTRATVVELPFWKRPAAQAGG